MLTTHKPQIKQTDSPLKVIQCENEDIAMSYISKLAMFDGRYAQKSFIEIFNEIFACVTKKQYAVIALPYNAPDGQIHETPVAYVLWGEFNEMTLAMYSKNIRMLSPGEFKSGDDKWITQLCTPFGYQEELLELLTKELPDLFSKEKLKSLELFEKVV